jgi:ribonuclease HI
MKKHSVSFQWVRGHAENEYNNICDKLAVEASHNPTSIDVVVN